MYLEIIHNVYGFRISTISRNFFPVLDFFEVILKEILRERFTISGLLVKNMLIEQYHLEKQFLLLRHLFMFQDDLIFPFYRRLFERVSLFLLNLRICLFYETNSMLLVLQEMKIYEIIWLFL